MIVVVLAIWLVGAGVTKYSLEQMAFVTPIAVVVVGRHDRDRPALGEGRHRLACADDASRRPSGRLTAVRSRPYRHRCVTAPGRSNLSITPTCRSLAARPRASARSRRRSSSGAATRPRAGGARSSTARSGPHDPLLLGDMAVAVDRIRAAIAEREAHLRARRLRRRRHLRHGARRPVPARARRGRRLAPAEPLRGGLRRLRTRRLAARRRGLRPARSPSTAGSRRSTRSPKRRRRGLEVIVTDHHRPGRARCPTARSSRRGRRAIRFPELCGTGVVYKLAQALLGADHPASRNLDLVALATIADVVPLVDENRSLAIAGLRALARTQRPGLQALMRNARRRSRGRRRRRGRLPARSADQRRRAARPPGRRARAAAHERRRRGTAARRRARGAEPRPAGGRGADPARGDRRGRGVARAEAAPPRLRALGRGLARGRDRDRRVAPRRALQPTGRPDRRARTMSGRDPAARSPAFDLHGALSACSDAPRAIRRPPGRRRPFDRTVEARGVRGRRSPPMPTLSSSTTTSRR